MKTRLSHVRANVKDLKKAVKWYEAVLGYTVVASWPPERPNYVHFAHEGGAMFGLMESEHSPSFGRFNFYVDDVDRLWEELKDNVDVVEALFSTPYGSRKFTICDIDGNELGFVQDDL
ncbi:VOC family protein [Virgibacillus sp. NKC19-3]|uniref:VOC family protein n=1 Tax=Virgibacillus saliphilus TaxID=2831674 RepID=UPI001C9B3957|nr:VOC family protein [Virgibacillus sp. NKC19-3]MBY7143946.1 VOC family protein [Virgibacillus sp. NKC19-3]